MATKTYNKLVRDLIPNIIEESGNECRTRILSDKEYIKDFIREISEKKDHFEHYDSDFELYVFTKTIAWNYEQHRPYKGDTIHEERRMYLHLYYNPEKQVDDAKNFNRRMLQYREEILSGRRVPEHEKEYRKYFNIKETPKRGISITYRQENIDAAHERYGFFILLSPR